jgi:hypothetical protein
MDQVPKWIKRECACLLLIAQSMLVAACGSTKPTSTTLEGQWSGTTSQGTPIGFTVSADQKVTAITIGHRFGGCAGTQTFDNLNLETAPNVICVPGAMRPLADVLSRVQLLDRPDARRALDQRERALHHDRQRRGAGGIPEFPRLRQRNRCELDGGQAVTRQP